MEILTKLLEFRGMARRFFQKYQLITEPIFRFIISWLAFHTINNALAYNTTVANPVIELVLAGVGAFLPPVVLILLCAMLAILQVYSASPILAALVIVIFAVLYEVLLFPKSQSHDNEHPASLQSDFLMV